MPAAYQPTVERIQTTGGFDGQMRETLRRIGSAIREASVYPPIRNHAAAIATLAGPKDFLGQLKAVYKDFIGRWRYVKDPVSKELVTASPQAIWRLTMAGDGVGVGLGKGAGDCDCATTALGAMLESIGFRTRLGTTSPPNAAPGHLFGHVFIQAHVPRFGWITVDPVLHPKKPPLSVADHSRIAFWDLDGNLLEASGNYTGVSLGEDETIMNPNIEQWPDYGFAGLGADPEPYAEPQDWETVGLGGLGYIDTPNGRQSAVAAYGIIPGEQLNGLCMEVGESEEMAPGLYRTPMIELALDDYAHVMRTGQPYDGMLGISDVGELYAYDGLGGFFKRLFRKVRSKVKKVAGRIRSKIRKVLKKSKFGRVLLKVGGAIKKVAMKVVRPLVKFVGKYAGKLAPIAALIPGFGPAIAGGLMVAGKVAKVMTKWGAKVTGPKGTVRRIQMQDPRALPGMVRDLRAQAMRMAAAARQNPARFRAMATRLAR